MDTAHVFDFLLHKQASGERCVLVMLGAVEGASMRNPGTVMGVAEDGSFAGSFSGGCIENAVVSEAAEVLKSQEPRSVRFGAGSPYLDIRLPCGGGLDLRFVPLTGPDLARSCTEMINGRRPFSLELKQGAVHCIDDWRAAHYDPSTGDGVFGYLPAPKLVIVGHGANVAALANQAGGMGCNVAVLSPDERVVGQFESDAIRFTLLTHRSDTAVLKSDPWTAIVFLFHDHDWEIDLMARALEMPHFYIGAMGGRRAHQNRCAALSERGVSQAQLDTIHAPIGLFHSSRDPQTLALSTLAEVIRAYEGADFAAGLA